ncbi:MAG: nitroreductase family protein [Candidatus Bathyarchaeia archaeon]
MEVFEAVRTRKSIRAYEPTQVPKEKLEKILEAARLAPSAGHTQPWHFIVVTDSEKRREIARSGMFARFLDESPVVIVGCGDRRASPKWYAIDTAIAMQNMVLTATAEGLGTCWIGSFREGLVREMLRIPERFRIVALLAVGYPRKKSSRLRKIFHRIRRRKKLKAIVSLEEYGKPFLGETAE